MVFFTAILIFILGTSIGSFLSVVIYRLEKKKLKIMIDRSICPNCKKKIKWRHLIPIFSWVFLRGECAYCKEPISGHYVALELVTGLLFVAGFYTWNFINVIPSTINPTFLNYQIDWMIFSQFFYYIVISSFLIAIFSYDLIYKKIPDSLSIPAIALAFIAGFLFTEPEVYSMLIGGGTILSFFALQFFLSNGKWIGGGDLRLGLLMGLILGWEKSLVALAIAYLIGGLLSIFLLATNKVTRKTAIPFGPFLITGTFIALFFGEQIINWYLNIAII